MDTLPKALLKPVQTVIGKLSVAAAICVLTTTNTRAEDWMTWASTYTHDPVTAERIDQYALPEEPLGPGRSAVQRSGYRHYRSTLQAGQSNDNLHIVEQWGRQVIPYEQWRFPYRPYAVPYGAWGPQPPYGIFNGQVGFGFRGGYGLRPGHPGVPGPGPGGIPPRRTPAEVLPGTGTPPGSTSPGGFPGGGGQFGNPRGFPLQPQYLGQPWYDGTYPPAPALDQRPDAAFFYHPPLGRKEQPSVPATP